MKAWVARSLKHFWLETRRCRKSSITRERGLLCVNLRMTRQVPRLNRLMTGLQLLGSNLWASESSQKWWIYGHLKCIGSRRMPIWLQTIRCRMMGGRRSILKVLDMGATCARCCRLTSKKLLPLEAIREVELILTVYRRMSIGRKVRLAWSVAQWLALHLMEEIWRKD